MSLGKAVRMKQNLTISLEPDVITKCKVIAARRSTSISRLLSEQVELIVGNEEAYERSQRAALTHLEKGFHLGGLITASRDDLHER